MVLFLQVYAMVHDESAERETAVCGSTYRESVVYTSRSYTLQLSIMATSTPDKATYFLFKYEGTCSVVLSFSTHPKCQMNCRP